MKKNFFYTLIIFLLIWGCNNKNNNLDFYNSTENLEKGTYVLSPDFETYSKLSKNGFDSVVTVFFKRILIKGGEEYSQITDGLDTALIANYLIIPLVENDISKLKKGQVLLTWNRATNSMQKVFVVDKINNKSVVIHYLDYELEPNALESGDFNIFTDTVENLNFLVLSEDFVSGENCFIKDFDGVKYLYTVINASDDKVLALQWSGTLKVFNKADCELLPLNKFPNEGDSVEVPYFGIVIKGVVTNIDSVYGRIWVRISQFDEVKDISVGLGNFKF